MDLKIYHDIIKIHHGNTKMHRVGYEFISFEYKPTISFCISGKNLPLYLRKKIKIGSNGNFFTYNIIKNSNNVWSFSFYYFSSTLNFLKKLEEAKVGGKKQWLIIDLQKIATTMLGDI